MKVPRPILLIAVSGSLVLAAMAASDAYVVDVDDLEPGQVLAMAANVLEEKDGPDLDGRPDMRPVLASEVELGVAEIGQLREAGVARVRVTDFRWAQWKWRWAFVAGCAGMLVSGVMMRDGAKRAAGPTPGEPVGADAADAAETAVRLLASEASQLRAETTGRADDETRHRIVEAIDAIRRGPLADVHRTMDGLKQHERGYARYAEVVIPLSAGERALHRSWSSAVDGDAGEARASLDRAVAMLEEAARAPG